MPSLVPIQATLFRGGTSKGPLFLASDLPRDKGKLDAVLLAAMDRRTSVRSTGLAVRNRSPARSLSSRGPRATTPMSIICSRR